MKYWLIIVIILGFATSFNQKLKGQEKPPKPIKVTVNLAQGIEFGSFVHGESGGTVSITPAGVRSATGNIILINQGASPSPAIFLVEGNKGTLITITLPASATLTGSNGGSLLLNFGNPNSPDITSCGSPFILTAESPFTLEVRIGGTLTIGSSIANPPGTYGGNFAVTFNQQ